MKNSGVDPKTYDQFDQMIDGISKIVARVLPFAAVGVLAGCVTIDYKTPAAEKAPVPSSTAGATNSETPFVQVTPTVEPSPTLEMTATAEATATETIEIKNDFESINKNIDDYLNGTLNYWGLDREYMFVDGIGGEEVEIGRTYGSYVNAIGLNFDVIDTVAVMLGRVVNDGKKIYIVLGSEKNGQRLVWLLNLGMADKNEYPQLSQVRLISLGESHPLYNANYNGVNMIYPDEMAKRLSDVMNRPIEISVIMGHTNEVNPRNCGVLDKRECDFYFSEYDVIHFSSLSNWLVTGENFNEAKNSECVVNQLSQDSIENIKTPHSGQIQLPIIR